MEARLDPRRWEPVPAGATGYVKRSPLIDAEVVQELDQHRSALSRRYRRRVSWDQVAACAASVVPSGQALHDAVSRHRATSSAAVTPTPRRRVCALVPYAAADRIEDLATDLATATGRRVRLDEVWTAAFAALNERLRSA